MISEKLQKYMLKWMLAISFVLVAGSGPYLNPTSRFFHEVLGLILFAAVLLHVTWNRRFLQSLRKGKYGTKRKLLTGAVILLIVTMGIILLSAPFSSRILFASFGLPGADVGRAVHLVATAWVALFAGLHFGVHYANAGHRLLQYVVAALGVASFVHLKYWERLFYLAPKMYVPDVPVALLYVEPMLVMAAAAVFGAAASRIAGR